MRTFYLLTLIILSTYSLSLDAQNFPERPSNYTPINDFAGILEDSETEALNNQLSKYEKEASTQIAVVSITSLEGVSIESYANKLFNQWGIGQKGADNGVLLLIAKSDRKMRIELGYGMEAYITDAEAGRIIDKILSPNFKNGDFAEGIELAIAAIYKEVGFASFEPVLASPPSSFDFVTDSFVWVWVFMILAALLQGLIGYFLTWKVEDGLYYFLINTLFVVLAIILLVAASEEKASLFTYFYLPAGLSGLCILLYLLVLLPKSVGSFVGQAFFYLFVLVMSSLPAFFVTALVAALISENIWFMGTLFIITTVIFFYLFASGKIDMSSSGGSYSGSSYSSGGSSYSYSDYSSSYSDSSSWGGGSSGGGGASGSW